jgi:hypothetical protein
MKKFFLILMIIWHGSFLWASPLTPGELKKTVLYLGGGDQSPWYFLGVFYAIDAYKIPVDSIVASSWGAWVSALWMEGFSPDAIQKLFLDPEVKPFVGQEQLSLNRFSKKEPLLPIGNGNIPSLQMRFFIESDTAGFLKMVKRPLNSDSLTIKNALFHFRIQESLSQKMIPPRKPFSALSCDGTSGKSMSDIFKTLPLVGHHASGELCHLIPLPSKNDSSLISIVAVPVPLRNKDTITEPWKRELWHRALQGLKNSPSPIVILRPHQMTQNTPEAWIQAGFSAVESRLGDLSKVLGRKPSSIRSLDSLVPWFRYNPSFEKVPSEIYSHIKSYWNPADTGIKGPEHFVSEIMSNPLYDSLSFELQDNGDLLIGASAPTLIDFKLGGFGSNIWGPNAYSKIDFRFINQFEYLFSIEAFYGLHSYGIRPELRLSRLWQGRGDFFVNADFSHREVLKKYFSEEYDWNRIFSESRTDLNLGFSYEVLPQHQLDFNVLFGSRTLETKYSKEEGDFESTPIEPGVTYKYSTPDYKSWFGYSGFSVEGSLSMRSIHAGVYGFIPMHYRSKVDLQYYYSPTTFLTLGAGAAGAISMYHKEGYGYVYPELLEFEPLDNSYRHAMSPTPWSTEWYFAEMLSYHYGLIRLQAGLHNNWLGLWIFGSYIKDFEENPTVLIKDHRFILEPTLRFAYRSFDVRAGLSRMVDFEHLKEFKDFKNYHFFVRFGAYQF